MQFSDTKKQLTAQKYTTELKELTRAHYFFSQERINQLIEDFEGKKLGAGDIERLISLAQDFVALYRLIDWDAFPASNIGLSSAPILCDDN